MIGSWRTRLRVAAWCVLFAAAGCTPPAWARLRAAEGGGQIVTLDRVPDPSPEQWWGMSNIFFAAASDSLRDVARFADGWTGVEVAEVVGGGGLRAMHAARFRTTASDEVRYVIDTAGTLDFTRAATLTFRRRGRVRIADIDLDVRSAAGARQRLPYQLLVADDGYTYARIAEYRTGRLRVDGREVALKLRPRSRDRPFYVLGPGVVVLADLDGDGRIAEQAAASVGGRPVAAEQLQPGAPFRVAGRALELSAIDSAGTRLVVRPSSARVAAAEGFRSPDLAGQTLSGDHYELARRPGEVTLITFWATDCPYSERVRPAVNALAAALRDERYAWVAVAKGRDRAAVAEHLGAHPMEATVVLADSAAWAAYDPEGVTPLFVVVDGRGVVRHRAMGASAVGATTEAVRRLVREATR